MHGPAETGKTISALMLFHILATKYENANLLILRKTLSSIYGTVLDMWQRKVLCMAKNPPIAPYGGEIRPVHYDYPNGSRIRFGGMDKSTKILSGEFDFIYVVQLEEFNLNDWEVLTTRTTGRSGNTPYARLMGDMNPAYPGFWVYERPSLKLHYSAHRDNPTLYDPATGEITEQGRRTMSILMSLTGVRRDRLYLGKPAMAEGAVFTEYDAKIHRIYEKDLPFFSSYSAAMDWGYTEPGTLLVYGHDWDGRLYVIEQYCMTGKTLDWWTDRARWMHQEYNLRWIVCDPSRPDAIQKLVNAGLPAEGGYNGIQGGIDAVKARLKLAADGKPRLMFSWDSLVTRDPILIEQKKPVRIEDEITGYVWATKKQDTPIDANNHGIDATRYEVCRVDGIGKGDGRRDAGESGL